MSRLAPYIFFVLLTSTASYGDAPDGVSIAQFGYSGSGCPSGSVAANLSPDGEALTLLFDDYVVDSTESRSGLARKDCNVKLKLDKPPGWSYALFCVDYRGFADLDPKVSSSLAASVSFGGPAKPLGQLDLRGPYSDDYEYLTAIPLAESPWSGCTPDNDTVVIKSVSTVDARSTPASQTIHLASSRHRYAESDLGRPIKNIRLVQQHSRTRCKKGHSFGIKGTKAWVHRGCRGSFEVTFFGGGASDDSQGLLTVDSFDGHVKHHYGIAWRKCPLGRWVQTNGRQTCQAACASKGMVPGEDPGGAQCASGEVRPSSAVGKIQFNLGCWPNCAPQGEFPSAPQGPFCYRPGQTRDFDRTDRTVGCYCKER